MLFNSVASSCTRALWAVFMLALGGCTGPASDDGCGWVRPVYLDAGDVLTPATARQVLVLNESWQRICSKGGTRR